MNVFGVGQENGRRGATSLALLQTTVAESGVEQGRWNRESICRARSAEDVVAIVNNHVTNKRCFVGRVTD